MSTTTKTVPDLFPLVIDGKTEWVKRGQYAKTTAEHFAIKLKADIKKSHIEEMLDAIEKNVKELNAEAPQEMHKTFDKVKDDWTEAVEEVEKKKQEEEEKKQAEEEKKKEEEQKQDALVKATTESEISLADLSKTFDTGNMDRFVAKKDVSNETLLAALKAGLGMSEFSNWMTGDLVVALEDRGQLAVCAKLAESMGKPFANIYNAAKTARNVPPDKRTKGVSYTIFAEIANGKYSDKPDEHKTKLAALVDKAAAGEIKSSQEARELKNKAQGKTPPAPKLPEEDEKHEFIVIDHEQTLVQVCVGFPKEALEAGATILDKKTGKMFGSMRAKPENRWTDLPIYKKPEPEAEKEEATGKGAKKKK